MTHPIVPDDITPAVLRKRIRSVRRENPLRCGECGYASLRVRSRRSEADYYCDHCRTHLSESEVDQ